MAEPKRYKEWEGVWVSEADHAALTTDRALFGTAFVEVIGEGNGRRIDPKSVYMKIEDRSCKCGLTGAGRCPVCMTVAVETNKMRGGNA